LDTVMPVLLRVTARVLELGQRVAAGDMQAMAELEAMAALAEGITNEAVPAVRSLPGQACR